MKCFPLDRAAILLVTVACMGFFTGCRPAPDAAGSNTAMTPQQKSALQEHKQKQDQIQNQ